MVMAGDFAVRQNDLARFLLGRGLGRDVGDALNEHVPGGNGWLQFSFSCDVAFVLMVYCFALRR